MDALKEFIIPLEGLSEGVHQFDFQLDNDFFEHFKNDLIREGEFKLTLYFDKRPDMIVLIFDFEGKFRTDCDRCLETIQLPIKDNQQLMVKYADEASEDADVVYITRETQQLNVARYAYESIGLAVPITKSCDSIENPPCNESMLDYLDGPSKSEQTDNPIWDALKGFNKKN
jgi:uncharacterized metal-binding protein YceD (DUF177 family)